MAKRALITGVCGQDGSYLAEYLLKMGYDVTGLSRYTEQYVKNIPQAAKEKILFVYGDVRDKLAVEAAIHRAQPDEIYNLAGQTFVPYSWTNPEETFAVNSSGLAIILNAVERMCPEARVYQASTSEMFGNVSGRLNENQQMSPRSPYGVSKLAAHHLARIYREKGLYVVCGILFNHEGPRRSPEMVTKKIAKAVAQWAFAKNTLHREVLKLGNLTARRDWGFAGDYVKAMHAMLQQPEPDDYVIGHGESHSVGEFLKIAVDAIGCKYKDVENLVRIDPKFTRQNEVFDLVADISKAERVLGWRPMMKFETLVATMVHHEISVLERAAEYSPTEYESHEVPGKGVMGD